MMYWWELFTHRLVFSDDPPTGQVGGDNFIVAWGKLPLCHDCEDY